MDNPCSRGDHRGVTLTETLRARIGAALLERYRTQEEAASAMGVAQGQVSNFLRGAAAWSAMERWEQRLEQAGIDPSGLLDQAAEGLETDEQAALSELALVISRLPKGILRRRLVATLRDEARQWAQMLDEPTD